LRSRLRAGGKANELFQIGKDRSRSLSQSHSELFGSQGDYKKSRVDSIERGRLASELAQRLRLRLRSRLRAGSKDNKLFQIGEDRSRSLSQSHSELFGSERAYKKTRVDRIGSVDPASELAQRLRLRLRSRLRAGSKANELFQIGKRSLSLSISFSL
jgi:two-component sensor histidine kinase